METKIKYVVLISADMEWRVIKKLYPNEIYKPSIWGEYFETKIENQKILFFQGGWGKVSAAGSTQFVIDNFKPEILINLGTCGGFENDVKLFDVILANKTIIYDIEESMGDFDAAINSYTSIINLSWLKQPYPVEVTETLLVSADKDLQIDEIELLKSKYHAVAGDWESGSIAYVANKNKKKILIFRGVSDLISSRKSEVYGKFDLFVLRAELVMKKLIEELPIWIQHIEG